MASNPNPRTLIIGLSGPSSSGKTTLARLLRGIFNIDASAATNDISIKLFILHEDDFYKRDADIPKVTVTSSEHGTRSLQDWDCVEALDLPALDATIRHVKRHGGLPVELRSKEDQNTVGDVGVSDTEVEQLRSRVVDWLWGLGLMVEDEEGGAQGHDRRRGKAVTICVLDGFLLFPPPPSLSLDDGGGGVGGGNSGSSRTGYETKEKGDGIGKESSSASESLMASLHRTLEDTLDLKLFLPSTKQKTLDRRARRTGYVTMEGFWEDPPGYVEEVVWPNYARDHAWMFGSREDVDEGRVDRGGGGGDSGAAAASGGGRVAEQGILVGPGSGEVPMVEVLAWGVDVVKMVLGKALKGRDGRE